MKKSISMQDIADRLGISKNSVYLALNDKPGVSVHLKKQIIDTAVEVGYGTYYKEKANSCVMVLVPAYLQGDMYFYSDIFLSITTEVKRCGYFPLNVVVTMEAEENLEVPTIPENMDLKGILVVGIFGNKYIQLLHSLRYPMVSIDIPYTCVPMTCVKTENFTGGYAATQYLIGKGHCNIGFVGPTYSAQSVYERWCGYRQAMDENQLLVEKKWCIRGHRDRLEFFDTAQALSDTMGEIKELPTAWFCAGDRIALAVINLMQRRGIRVPQDISVMGFDDLPVSEMLLPRLSTMHVQRKTMGKIAVRNLLQKDDAEDGPVSISLPCKLIERDSVAEPAK